MGYFQVFHSLGQVRIPKLGIYKRMNQANGNSNKSCFSFTVIEIFTSVSVSILEK